MAFTFPPDALAWLLDGCGHSMLVLADSVALPRGLMRRGFEVVTTNRDAALLRPGLDTPGLGLAVARVEALPFDDCCFDTVFVYQTMPDMAPGLALPEIARVLRPDGRLLVTHLGRDDSVPWVRRLASLMRSIDPSAMTALGAEEAVAPVQGSKLFHDAELHDFRHWQAITKDMMMGMVSGTPAVQALDEADRRRFLDTAAEIHDEAAGGNNLRLPYQLRCWRGVVDQDELTRPVHLADPALVISL